MNPSNQMSAQSTHYLQQKAETATPLELIIMLYEGGIKFLNQSKMYAEQKNHEKKCETLINAQEVIRELKNSLDMSITEISPKLASLYNYMLKRLIAANVEKKMEYVDEVIKMLSELRDVWVIVNRQESANQQNVASFRPNNGMSVSITA